MLVSALHACMQMCLCACLSLRDHAAWALIMLLGVCANVLTLQNLLVCSCVCLCLLRLQCRFPPCCATTTILGTEKPIVPSVVNGWAVRKCVHSSAAAAALAARRICARAVTIEQRTQRAVPACSTCRRPIDRRIWLTGDRRLLQRHLAVASNKRA